MHCGDASAGGDALLTICLWKAGYAHTDPGFSFYHPTVRMFDPGPENSPGLLYAMTEALSGRCDPSCQVISACLLVRPTPPASLSAADTLPTWTSALAATLDCTVISTQLCLCWLSSVLQLQGQSAIAEPAEQAELHADL